MTGQIEPANDANPAGWRCFHCNEYFANPNLAKAHFGDYGDGTPACILKAEQGLVYLLREQERQLHEYRAEDNAMARTFYALGAEHATALIREEQKGYDKGLADGRAAIDGGAASPFWTQERLERLIQHARASAPTSTNSQRLADFYQHFGAPPQQPDNGMRRWRLRLRRQ